MPVEPTKWFEGWDFQSHPPTSGEGRETGKWPESIRWLYPHHRWHYPELIQSPQCTASVPEDCPLLQTPITSLGLPRFWLTWYKSGFPTSPSWVPEFAGLAQNLKVLSLVLVFYYKSHTTYEQLNGRSASRKGGTGVSDGGVSCPVPQVALPAPNSKTLRTPLFGDFYGESTEAPLIKSLANEDWFN